MKTWNKVAVVLFAAGLGFAQSPVQAADKAPANPRVIERFDLGDGPGSYGEPLEITRMDVAVDLAGGSARSVVTVSFRSKSRNQSEGDFNLDLPAHSVITGYALDVDGTLVDGVLVSQRQGTQAFETQRRRRVDPGLGEVTRAGDFHVRVFPIGMAPRTIRLEFVTPIGPGERYVMPLHDVGAAGPVNVSVRTADGRKPAVLQGPQGLELAWSGTAARAGVQKVALDGDLVLAAEGAAKPLLTLSRHQNGETFFDLVDPKGAPAAAEPRRVRVFWDVSRSRRDDDLKAEQALLDRYLAQTKARMVDLVTFADQAPTQRRFSGPTAAAGIRAALEKVSYRGATSLKPLYAARGGDADVCLMFTDGDPTLDDFAARSLGCPLYVISSAADARADVLAALARASAGEAIDLRALGLDSALERLTAPRPHITGVTAADGSPIPFIQLASDSGLHLVGPLDGQKEVMVQVAGEGAPRRYAVTREDAPLNDAPAALWAAGRLADMAVADQTQDKALLELARRYQVAAAGMVFVVLEQPGDYVNADIVPPASLGAEKLALYRSLYKEAREQKARAKSERIETVAAAWAEQRQWWQKTFRPELQNGRAPKTSSRLQGSQVPMPSPPAQSPRSNDPPRATLPPGDDEGTQVEMVVVTSARLSPNYQDVPVAVSAFTDRGRARRVVEVDDDRIETELRPWSLDRPYLKALDAAGAKVFAATLDEQEALYGEQPSFYFDVAEYLYQKGRRAEALAYVVNALETPAADTRTLTVLADRLMRYGDRERALWLYEKILRLEPDRPQPHRNLALALIDRADAPGADPEQAKADYARGLGLLNEVIMNPWNGDYDGVEMVALMEANRALTRLRMLGGGDTVLDRRLIAPLDVDLRVVLEWNTDKTDIDLWIDEPTGERAFYSNPSTVIGGRLSNDMTAGYGPEEYLLHRARKGPYDVKINVYAVDRFNPNGATSVRAKLYRNYGRRNETAQVFEIELSPDDDATREVGKFTVGKPGASATPG